MNQSNQLTSQPASKHKTPSMISPDAQTSLPEKKILSLPPQVFYCLFVITCLSFGLRWAMRLESGLWGDEALCLFVARFPHLSDTFDFLRFHESHPPFNYLLLRGWTTLFGTGEAVLNLPSAIFGSAAVAVTFWVAYRVFGFAAACLAGCFAMLSPELLDFSSQVRPYGLLQLLTITSCFLLWQIRHAARPALWYGYILCATLMVYTHNWCWLVVAAQAVCYLSSILIAMRNQNAPVGKLALAAVGQGALSLFAIVILYLPWLPVLVHQGQAAGHPSTMGSKIKQEVAQVVLHSLDIVTPWRSALSQKKTGIVWLLIVGLLAIGAFLYRRQTGKPLVNNKTQEVPRRNLPLKTNLTDTILFFGGIFWVTLLVAIPLSVKSDLLQYKCVSMLLPGLYVLWGGGVAYVARIAWKKEDATRTTRLPFQSAVIILFGLISFSIIKQDVELWGNPKSFAREYASIVAVRAQPDELIVIAPPWFSSSFNWYYQRTNPQIDYPHFAAEQAMAYDNLLNLYSDPVAYKKVADALTQHARSGKGVWLLTAGDVDERGVDSSSPELPLQDRHSWIEAGKARGEQIYQLLHQEFGKSPEKIIPANAKLNRTGALEYSALYYFSKSSQ